jgi:transcriptional regulator with XRE-family HTH domain
MAEPPGPTTLPASSSELLAEYRAELLLRMREAGLSDDRLGKLAGFDRTTVNKVRKGHLEPSPQFAQKTSEVLGERLLMLWRAWDGRRLREGAKAKPGRYDHRGQQPAGVVPKSAGQPRELKTLDLAAWIADRSSLSFQETYASIITRLHRLAALGPGERYAEAHRRRHVTREQLATALASYYRDPSPSDVGAMFYRAHVSGRPLTLSILVRRDWLDVAVKLDSDQEDFRLAASTPSAHLDRLEGTPLTAALDRLAEVEVSGTVVINSPIYRLLDVAITRHRLKATVALADFASYALTMDLLETELVTALMTASARTPDITDPADVAPHLPLRQTYLPTVTSALALSDRLCAGGPVALLAAARGLRRGQGERDFVLLVQERSARVLNVTGRLAVVPKAFHGPTVEATEEARLSASLEREVEEELLGRQDLEQLTEGSYRRADPFHPDHLSEPMRWLIDRRHTDAYRVECVGFGVNMITGNYEFPCLIVIDDEEWWARFGGQVEANWEIARIRRYSSRDTAGLQALAMDPRWSNEGLFAFLEGLRRLAELDTVSRLALPRIDVEA